MLVKCKSEIMYIQVWHLHYMRCQMFFTKWPYFWAHVNKENVKRVNGNNPSSWSFINDNRMQTCSYSFDKSILTKFYCKYKISFLYLSEELDDHGELIQYLTSDMKVSEHRKYFDKTLFLCSCVFIFHF